MKARAKRSDMGGWADFADLQVFVGLMGGCLFAGLGAIAWVGPGSLRVRLFLAGLTLFWFAWSGGSALVGRHLRRKLAERKSAEQAQPPMAGEADTPLPPLPGAEARVGIDYPGPYARMKGCTKRCPDCDGTRPLGECGTCHGIGWVNPGGPWAAHAAEMGAMSQAMREMREG